MKLAGNNSWFLRYTVFSRRWMIMLKIKKWIYFEKKKYNPVILIFSLLLSGLFFFISLEGIAYLIFRDRIKDYTSDVLNRAESLMLQVDTVNAAARSSSDVSSWPCSYENLQHLRGVVWPYSLIKDVGYTSKIGLTCSAIWGVCASHYLLIILRKKSNQRKAYGCLVLH